MSLRAATKSNSNIRLDNNLSQHQPQSEEVHYSKNTTKTKLSTRATGVESAYAAVHAALQLKALDVIAFDVREQMKYADFIVIASGTSDRHVRGISDNILKELQQLGEYPLSVTGYDEGEWILSDFGDVIVHVFFEPTRQYYAVDSLWTGAQQLELSPEMKQEARSLRTGAYRLS